MSAEPMDTISEQAAIALAGANAVLCDTDGAVVVVGDDAMVVIAEPADRPTTTGVWSSCRFRLYGPLPGEVGVRLFGHHPDSSQWSWSRPRDVRPFHLLVRLDGDCLYLGVGKPRRGSYNEQELRSAELTIDPPLTRQVLDHVRPPVMPDGLPGLSWLADVTDDPSTALRRFVEEWVPETDASAEEYSAAGWDVPAPLAEFYRLAGRRPALLGRQNYLDKPSEWHTHPDGKLVVFGGENQGCFGWAFDPAMSDPAVWIGQDGYDGLRLEHEPMSGFLLQFALFETMMNAPYNAWGNVSPEAVNSLTATLTLLPWRPWRWPNDSKRFFVAPALIATVTESTGGGFYVWAGALHRSVLRPLEDLGIPWSGFDG